MLAVKPATRHRLFARYSRSWLIRDDESGRAHEFGDRRRAAATISAKSRHLSRPRHTLFTRLSPVQRHVPNGVSDRLGVVLAKLHDAPGAEASDGRRYIGMQTSLLRHFTASAFAERREREIEVWDLFCGAGGFSEGARQAGCRIAFACDADEVAVGVHAMNHPDATHVVCTLPCEVLFPVDGRRFHVHGSPPCQRFSTASGGAGSSEAAVRHAEWLVSWYIDTALASYATSWSMEQVASPSVLSILESKRAENRSNIDYDVFDFSMLGVPQHRRRVIAGTPSLIAKLRRQTMTNRRNKVSDFISNCRGTHIRHSRNWTTRWKSDDGVTKYKYKKAGWGDFLWPTDKPSPTIVAKRVHSWVSKTRNGLSHTTFLPADAASLQTFPSTYTFTACNTVAHKLIGNAVPPFVADLIIGPENSRESSVVLECEQARAASNKQLVLADPGSPSYSSEKCALIW